MSDAARIVELKRERDDLYRQIDAIEDEICEIEDALFDCNEPYEHLRDSGTREIARDAELSRERSGL